MSERNWAAGLWKQGEVEHKQNYAQIPIYGAGGMECVCFVVGTTNPMLDWYAGARDLKANAHVIAAAPELFEALEAACEWDGQDMEGVDAVWLDRARAALAKAKGEQV